MDPSKFAEVLIARASRWSVPQRYAVATLLVAAAALLRAAFEPTLHGSGYFVFAFAVGLSAIFLDWTAAIWASVLSALTIDYVFQQPRLTFALETTDAVGLALFMIGCLLIIIGGQSVQLLVQRLHRASAEKDALYRELRHRINNNLHIIGTTVDMEASRTASTDARGILKGVAGRIAAIAQVDQLLGARGVDESLRADDYLRELCEVIVKSLIGRRPLSVTCEAEVVMVSRDLAEALGIAVNELVTNAIKHAFADATPGHIVVRLTRAGDGLRLAVEDNGKGCPSDARGGTGWTLVASLIGKFEGTMATERAKPGCRVVIAVPRRG